MTQPTHITLRIPFMSHPSGAQADVVLEQVPIEALRKNGLMLVSEHECEISALASAQRLRLGLPPEVGTLNGTMGAMSPEIKADPVDHWLVSAWSQHMKSRAQRGITDGSQLTHDDHAFIELYHAMNTLHEQFKQLTKRLK